MVSYQDVNFLVESVNCGVCRVFGTGFVTVFNEFYGLGGDGGLNFGDATCRDVGFGSCINNVS